MAIFYSVQNFIHGIKLHSVSKFCNKNPILWSNIARSSNLASFLFGLTSFLDLAKSNSHKAHYYTHKNNIVYFTIKEKPTLINKGNKLPKAPFISIHSLFSLNTINWTHYFLLCHQDNKTYLQIHDHLIQCLDTPLRLCFLTSQSPTINFIILFYSTSNTTLFFVLPNLAKLAQDGKAAYNFSIKRTWKHPFFPELSSFIKTDHFYLNIPSTAMGIRKKIRQQFYFYFRCRKGQIQQHYNGKTF